VHTVAVYVPLLIGVVILVRRHRVTQMDVLVATVGLGLIVVSEFLGDSWLTVFLLGAAACLLAAVSMNRRPRRTA
jgi:drug/metabolite transporter (DMT)-like permease